MTVVPIKNGNNAIINDLDDYCYYIREYMGEYFLDELCSCISPINTEDELEQTKQELQSYEASLESAQRALMDIKEIVQRISEVGRVRQSQTALDAIQEIIKIVDQEV